MGIYDREYYRDDTGGPGWFSGVAPATRTILAINIGVWLVQYLGPNLRLEQLFALRSDSIFNRFEIWRLLTAAFLHSRENVFHILWNMLFLYWFGREMESMQGSREFTCFYIAAAVVSSLGWAIVDRVVPGGRAATMLGASGAITAVAMVFTLYFPNREVLLLFIPVRMWILLTIYLSRDALVLLQGLNGEGIAGESAVACHLAGAAFGYLYKAGGLRLSQFLRWRFRPRLRVIVPERREPSASRAGGRTESVRPLRPMGANQVSQEQLDARLDEVLAKIAREGRTALTDEEKSILDEASRRARLRRSDKL